MRNHLIIINTDDEGVQLETLVAPTIVSALRRAVEQLKAKDGESRRNNNQTQGSCMPGKLRFI